MLAVEIEKLTKRFGGLTAVDGLDMSIEQGETYGLLGPNGSGKTTTIKMLCGLLKPSSGRVAVLGRELPSKSVMQEIGYMPQETAVYLDNTVYENLRLFGEIYGMPKDDMERRVAELLAFVDLSDRRDSVVSALSGGMKHRLSLACALMNEPRLLILDEPTVGVDPELRAAFWEYFRALGRNGVTVVITTHYMDEAGHCSKVGLLRDGKLIAEGEPGNLKKDTGTDSLEDAFLALTRRRE